MFRNPVAVLWPKPPEVNAHPQHPVSVLEHIDVMVPAADGPELLARQAQQPALPVAGRGGDGAEHWVIANRFVVAPAHAERDARGDGVGDAAALGRRQLHPAKVRPHRQVPARDVVADP